MKYIITILTVTILVSCSSNEASNESLPLNAENKIDSNSIVKDSNSNISQPIVNLSPIWEIDDDGNGVIIKKIRTEDSAMLTPTHLTNVLNNLWKEKVLLFFEKQSNDTAYVTIPESDYLTQKMGSTGAEGYMMSVVYTLTELKGIKKVNFNFVEGDHASPGAYTRRSFRR